MDPIRVAALNGYNVLSDCRGRYNSEGHLDLLHQRDSDGYDTIEWAARQPWANGKVGTLGSSYMGVTQWLAATQTPPSLKAMAPCITASNYHDGWTYQGGAFALGFNLSWTMIGTGARPPDARARRQPGRRVQRTGRGDGGNRRDAQMDGDDAAQGSAECSEIGAPYFFDWLEHPRYDSYWRKIDIETYHEQINVPAFNIGGWYDIFLGGTMRNYLGMSAHGATPPARAGQRLLVGPWAQGMPRANMAGEVDFGYRAAPMSIDQDRLALNFFDRWLKGIENRHRVPARCTCS